MIYNCPTCRQPMGPQTKFWKILHGIRTVFKTIFMGVVGTAVLVYLLFLIVMGIGGLGMISSFK